MQRLMLGAAFCVLSLIAAPQAQAQPGRGGPGRGPGRIDVNPGRGGPGRIDVNPGRGRPDLGHSHGHAHSHGRPYYHSHGTRYSGGYYYRGQDHSHWGHRTWDPGFRRYHYYDPFLRVYFYWNPTLCGYYPVGTIVLP